MYSGKDEWAKIFNENEMEDDTFCSRLSWNKTFDDDQIVYDTLMTNKVKKNKRKN